MRKLIKSFLFFCLLGAAGSAHAFNPIRYVQISTNSLSQQTGAVNIASGTIATINATKITVASTMTFSGPLIDKNLSAGTTFDYLNSQSSGTSAAPQWSHAGLVLQSSQTVVFSSSGTTSANLAKTNVLITITPKFSSSIFILTGTGEIRNSNAATDSCALTIERNATNLVGGQVGMTGLIAPSGDIRTPFSLNYMDSPNTSSAITYQLYIGASGGGGTCELATNMPSIFRVVEIGQ